MKKKSMLLGIPMVAVALLLGGCDEADSQPKEPSHEAMKQGKFDLEYYEVLANGDSEDAKTDIAYQDDGKTKHVYPSADSIHEHILKDGDQKPYVVEDDGDYHIYRPPYMTYGDDNVSGTVDSKDTVKNDK